VIFSLSLSLSRAIGFFSCARARLRPSPAERFFGIFAFCFGRHRTRFQFLPLANSANSANDQTSSREIQENDFARRCTFSQNSQFSQGTKFDFGPDASGPRCGPSSGGSVQLRVKQKQGRFVIALFAQAMAFDQMFDRRVAASLLTQRRRPQPQNVSRLDRGIVLPQ
jgi:hypothetical protein